MERHIDTLIQLGMVLAFLMGLGFGYLGHSINIIREKVEKNVDTKSRQYEGE